MGIVILLILAGVLPVIYGWFWKDADSRDPVIFYGAAGFLTMLGLFEILGVPMVFARVGLKTQAIVFSAVLFAGAVLAVILMLVRKMGRREADAEQYGERAVRRGASPAGWFRGLSDLEVFYLAVLTVLIVFPLIYTAFFDIGPWTSDDGVYVTISTAALHDGKMFASLAENGDYTYLGNLKYMFSGIYVFYTYCAYVSGVAPAVLEHTVFAVVFFLMSAGVWALLAGRYIKERENRFIFLIFIALLHLFGKFSQYSVSFRLFGPIWQGKAVLAVIVLPFLLYFYPKAMEARFRWKNLLLLMLLSLAAIALTLGGIITMVLVTTAMTVIHFIRGRNFKNAVYYLFANIFPVLIGCLYVMNNGTFFGD